VLETTFKGKVVTRNEVIAALEAFAKTYPDPNAFKGPNPNASKGWLDNDAYHWAINYQNRLYPPKHILREIIKDSRFKSGDPVNQVFLDLDFAIVSV
jgi:hypothetical protein